MSQEDRKAEVLEQLDAAQKDFLLSGPGNKNFPSAALRMDGYSSDTEWLLVIQMLAWHRANARFVLDIQAFGNNVPDEQKNTLDDVIRPAPEQALFGDSSEDFEADLHAFTILIDGEPTRFQFSEQDYAAAGIDLHTMAPALAFLRILAAREPDKFLLSPAQLLDKLGKSGLDHLFTLDEWRHPDEAEDELPSETACFQEIAQIVAEGAHRTPSACTEDSNTDWSHWLKYER